MSLQSAPPELTDTQKILALLEGMNQRMVRLEASVARLDALVVEAPNLIGGVTDTVDGVMAGLSSRGVDVDARVRGALELTEKLTEPKVLAALEGILGRMDALEEATALVAEGPALVGGVTDTVDGVMAGLSERGVDVDARLRAALVLAEKLTAPEMVALVDRLVDSAPLLEQALDLAETAPAALAGVTDTVDGVMARVTEQGVDLDARLQAGLSAAEKLTRPETLAALEKLADNTATLEQALDLAEQAPKLIAGVTDTVDGIVAGYAARGVDLDERLSMLLVAAENLTDPTLLRLLTTVTERGDQLSRLVDVLLESGIFDEYAVDVVGHAGTALVQTRQGGIEPKGAFGALGAMGDPDVQRAVGFGLGFAKRFGRMLDNGH